MNQTADRPKILIICDYYLPGYEAGGPIRTLVNMVERFGDKFDFRIITRDHDGKKNRTPYTSVKINEWNKVGISEVFYLSKNNIRPSFLRKLVLGIEPEVIYVSSFFSPLTVYTLILRKIGKIPYLPLILVPEGELSAGSLSLKHCKKSLYMRVAKLLNLYQDVIWKAAAEAERREIELFAGKADKLFIASPMTPKIIFPEYDKITKPEKRAGRLRIVFLSRIMRTKNLHWLLNQLSKVKGELELNIYGPIENSEYWQECSRIISTLPANVAVFTGGTIPHHKVPLTIAKYDFFILPTIGENFGYVFIEALAAGCPLIISDRTPWRDLAKKGIGWDLPLESPESWIEILKKCINMSQHEYDEITQTARQFAIEWLQNPSLDESNIRVLEYALNSGSGK